MNQTLSPAALSSRPLPARVLSADAPIGVFDSGIGGLSVLAALRVALPRERFIYYADSAHSPYGEKSGAFVQERSLAIAEELIEGTAGIKALVVACNTATAAAIALLRERWPGLPIIGIEPALKPAITLTTTGRIGVMATRGTLESARFAALLAGLQHEAAFVMQPCDGLAEAIDRDDAELARKLCDTHLRALGRFGSKTGEIDTVVLGCTHYPLVIDTLMDLLPDGVELVHTGPAVARQCGRVLRDLDLVRQERAHAGEVEWRASGTGDEAFDSSLNANVTALRNTAERWLGFGG